MNYLSNVSGDDAGSDVFLGCTSIVGTDGTTYDASEVDWHKMHADTGGYLTGVAQPVAIFSESAQTLYFLHSNSWINGSYHLTGSTDPIAATTMFIGDEGLRNLRSDNPGEGITIVVFDTSFADYSPTYCNGWFDGCSNLTTFVGLENLNTSATESMYAMFKDCSSLTNLDLSTFNTGKVTDMMSMFEGCSNLQTLNISNFATDSVTVFEAMFSGCAKLQALDVSGFNTSKAVVFNEMFKGCASLQTLNLSGFDTSLADDMMGMFNGCSSLTSLDLSSFNTSQVYNMNLMFYNCENLTDLNVISFDVSKVEAMAGMFAGCGKLTSLDLSNFNMSSPTSPTPDMRYMFRGDAVLEAVYISDGWRVYWGTPSTEMFQGCTSIVGEDGTTYDSNIVDYTRANADSEGYLRRKYITVTIPSSGLATFSAAQNVYVPEGLEAFTCVRYNPMEQTIVADDISNYVGVIVHSLFEEVPAVVPNHTGVLLAGTPGEQYKLPVTLREISVAADIEHDLVRQNCLVAVVEPTHVEPTDGDMTNFMLKSGKFIRIADSDESSKMPANKAYLQLPTEMISAVGEAAVRVVWNGDGPTAVELVEDIEGEAAEGIFDLNGRKVADDMEMLQTLPEGIYIINGKKILNQKK